jgi:hypothetical protein
MSAVREIEARNVHARLDQLLQHGVVFAGGTDGCNDLGLAIHQSLPLGFRMEQSAATCRIAAAPLL